MTEAVSHLHIYKGAFEIRFDAREKLYVEITTPRLYLRSVQPSDLDLYAALFADPEVMAKYFDGTPKPREYIQNRIENIWDKRWKNHDPYNCFAVFDRNTREFIGSIVLGHSTLPGESELAGLGKKAFWDKKLATEALEAIIKEYAPATLSEGYTLDGKPLERIISTARVDNPAAVKLLEHVGMQLQKTEEKHGALRHHYSIDLSQLPAPTLAKTERVSASQKRPSSAALLCAARMRMRRGR